MALGPAIRRMFGRHERRIADLYRSIYVDLDAFMLQITRWVPEARSILEVGCGEGAVTERLASAYPGAQILGIDVSPNIGRLYHGPREKVEFSLNSIEQIAQSHPQTFDLIILSDVLHHVPRSSRPSLLAAIGQAMKADGSFVFKEWERRPTPIFWMGYAADRWLTGDTVSFLDRAEARHALDESFGKDRVVDEARIRPWQSNLAFLITARP